MTRLNIYPYAGFKDVECDVVLIANQVVYEYSEYSEYSENRIMGVCHNKLPDNISSQIERLTWGSRRDDNEVLRRLIKGSLHIEELSNFVL